MTEPSRIDRYTVALAVAIDEARSLLATAASQGRESRVRNVNRLLGFLEQQQEEARSGVMPRREGYGYALTRYADEYEWGDEGTRLVDLVYELQHIWSEEPARGTALGSSAPPVSSP